MNKKYIVRLTVREKWLENLVRKGKTQAYRIKYANILLTVDADGPNWPDRQVAKAYKCHKNTVVNVHWCFVLQGFEASLKHKNNKRHLVNGLLMEKKKLSWYPQIQML